MWDIIPGNVDGVSFGKSTDKTSFFNTPTSPQRSNPMQAMIGAALPLGVCLTGGANDAALANANTLTTNLGVFTFTGLATTDFVMAVSKPTANTGFGIAGVFANAANQVGLILANPTAANAAPAQNETLTLAVLRGMNTITANLTPANVAANSTMEQVFTLSSANAAGTPIVNAAGQLVGANMSNNGSNYLFPPTVVFSTSNTGGPLLPYPNILTGTISASGGESQYGQFPQPYGTPVIANQVLSAIVLPTAIAEIANGIVVGIQVTNPGSGLPISGLTMSFVGGNTISPGMICQVNPAGFTAGTGIGNTRVVGNNQVAIEFFNLTAAVVTPYAGNYTFLALNSLPAVTNLVQVTSNLAAPANTGANATAAAAVSIPGLLATDLMQFVYPPAMAANAVALPGISAANAANIIQFAGTGTANTGAGAYTMGFIRAAAQPPMLVYSLYLTPSAVANNAVGEQIFTLPANLLVSGNPVLVNKQSLTGGISIVNARANSANTLAITFMNQTGAAVTPPAEPYLVASFPGLIPTIGTSGANSIGYGYSTQVCGITWSQSTRYFMTLTLRVRPLRSTKSISLDTPLVA